MAELTTLARPYAKAAFSHALASQQLDTWLKNLDEVAFIVVSEKAGPALMSPTQTVSQQVELIKSLLGGEIDKAVENFITLIADNKRLLLVPSIAEQFKTMKQAHEKLCDVEVVSAYDNSDEDEQKLAKALQQTLNSDVSISSTVDKNLIGGVVIRAGDLVIDNSIRGRLAKLNEALGL